MDNEIKRLDWLLSRVQLLDPLVLCKHIREEKGWSVPQAVSSAISVLDKELPNIAAPAGP